MRSKCKRKLKHGEDVENVGSIDTGLILRYVFMGFGLLGLWVSDIFFFFWLVFLVLLGMGFLVFDFFFFCGFGCDRGLWLKWRFVGCVGGGLVAVAVVVVVCVGSCGCVGGGLIFFFSCRGLWWSHRGCSCGWLFLAGGGCEMW